MRSSKNRSRNKNRNNNRSVGNVINRVFDSSGPEGKVRGTPQQIIDKYTQLASDAQLSNDRVAAENFQQHAEHYLRLLSEAQKEQEARREQQEREHRERQQQRDEQRQDRNERQRDDNRSDDVVDVPGTGDQPDVMGGSDDTGLVETPEVKAEKPSRPRKPRKPRAKAEPETAAPASGPEGSEAAE